jgi:hypothetical protein
MLPLAPQRDANQHLRQIQRATHTYARMFMLELDTGGNVRVEDGSPSCSWWSTCSELLHSAMFPADAQRLELQLSLNIRRITRIHNTAVRRRFDQAVGKLPAEAQPEIVHLFWIEPSHCPDELVAIVEHGFQATEAYGRCKTCACCA